MLGCAARSRVARGPLLAHVSIRARRQTGPLTPNVVPFQLPNPTEDRSLTATVAVGPSPVDRVSQSRLTAAGVGIGDPESSLAGHRLVNTLDSAVGAQRVRPGAPVPSAASGKEHHQGEIPSVTPGVAGHECLHAESVTREPPHRTPGNHRHRASTLIFMQLDLNPPLEPRSQSRWAASGGS
jgi:hypothetical protein